MPDVNEPQNVSANALAFVVRDHELLLVNNSIPELGSLSPNQRKSIEQQVFIGHLGEVPAYAISLAKTGTEDVSTGTEDVSTGTEEFQKTEDVFVSIRRLFGSLPDALVQAGAYASQILRWDRNFRYCGYCGTLTERMDGERARRCPACGLVSYPRISPAIIVAIRKGDRLLLARNSKFRNNMHSIIAGFVEAGESLEECVAREVREEVGIEVNNISYFGSQAWPYTDSLMVGFRAEHASGDIQVDTIEIVEAAWFRADELPSVPPEGSISRELIDWFIRESGAEDKQND